MLPLLTRPALSGCGDPGDEIAFACLLDADQYLTRSTPAAGDTTLWTFAAWLKRWRLGQQAPIFTAGTGEQHNQMLGWSPNDELFMWIDAGGTSYYAATAARYRDPCAWMHVVLVYDTAQADAGERLRLWVNGERVPMAYNANGPIPLGFAGGYINSTAPHYIGRADENDLRDGGAYIAAPTFAGGIAVTHDEFGYVNSHGVWVPRRYAGSFGATGFSLDFADPLNLGRDASGNDNHWSTSGLTADSQTTDTPTRNTLTLNPLSPASALLTEGNQRLQWRGTTSKWMDGSFLLDVDRPVRFSATRLDDRDYAIIGFCWGDGQPALSSLDSVFWFIRHDPTTNAFRKLYVGGVSVQTWSEPGANEICEFYIDGRAIHLGFNGEWYDGGGEVTAAPWLGGTPTIEADGPIPLCLTGYHGGDTVGADYRFDFGSSTPTDLDVSVDALPCPDILNPDDYVTIRTVSGGADVSDLPWNPTTTPTLVLAKRTDTTADWRLVATTRGAGTAIAINTTDAEVSESDGLTGFTSSGYTVGSATLWQGSRTDYIWRVGRRAGLDVLTVSHTNGVATTVPHAAGGPIDYAWVIPMGGGTRRVYHSAMPAGQYVPLNSDAVPATDAGWFGSTAVELTLGASMPTGEYLVCAWREVAGFSAFRGYLGNNNDDGPYCDTGMSPRMVFTRAANSTTYSAFMHDSDTGPNPNTRHLLTACDVAQGDDSLRAMDLLSQGIKLRTWAEPNSNAGGLYIVAAWAQTPGKFARAR